MSNDSYEAPHRPSARGARLLAAVAACCGLVLAIALFYPLLRGNIYQGSDLAAFHLPARAFYSVSLKEGFSPLWWPEQFCGYYLHGEGQVGMFHPLHLLLYRFLPLDWAFNLEFAGGYLFAFAGTLALLRYWRLPWFVALFGASGFAFCGFVLLHFMHMQAIAIIGHLPWLMLAGEVFFRSTSPSRAAWSAVALLTASQLLLGYPQYVLFSLVALAVHLAPLSFGAQVGKRLLYLALALITGLLIAGVQVLPTIDVLREAARATNAEHWRSGSLHPLNLLQWASPLPFPNGVAFGEPAWEYGVYTGVVPVLLAALMVAQLRGPGAERRRVAGLVGLAIVALILALGEYGGLYGLLARLPLIGAFRCSARHMVLVHLAVVLLAAMAMTRLWRGEIHQRTTAYTAGVLLPLAVIASAILVLAGGDTIRSNVVFLVAGPLALTVASAALLLSRRSPVAGLTLLMVFATGDTLYHRMPHVWSHPPQSTGLAALRDVLADELPSDFDPVAPPSDFRAHGNWRIARLTQLGLPNFQGYVGLPPAWRLDIGSEAAKRVAGVRWERMPLHSPKWTVREDALPRARLVTQVMVSDAPGADLADIDSERVVLLDSPVVLEGGTPGTVTWRRDEPGDLVLEVDTDSPQILVVAERFHHGWRATVDGQEISIQRAYGDFMACGVPGGKSTVTLVFRPDSFRQGVVLSVIGIALLIATVVSWSMLWRGSGRCNPVGGSLS